MKNQESDLLTFYSVPPPTKEEGTKKGREERAHVFLLFKPLNSYSAILREEKGKKPLLHVCVTAMYVGPILVAYNPCSCKSHSFLIGGIVIPMSIEGPEAQRG